MICHPLHNLVTRVEPSGVVVGSIHHQVDMILPQVPSVRGRHMLPATPVQRGGT
jgi:hypothetical protein